MTTVIVVLLSLLVPALAGAQQADSVTRIDLPTGRSYPITTVSPIVRVSIANPEIADVVVIGAREVVVNSKTAGETDAILWQSAGARQHYRISVHSPSDRKQIALYVKLAEVRRDALRELGVSARYVYKGTRVGTQQFRDDTPFQTPGAVTVTNPRFFTVLTDFDSKRLIAFIDAEETRGRAKILAEPNLLAANKEEATFLAGGELPIPIAQPSQNGASVLTIQFREFGVRLRFVPEIISDSLVKLAVRPEVSSLDFSNAIVISGFSIPAFRTRRVESTVDVRQNESLVISGMFNEDVNRTRSGVPFLMNLPILGNLFSSNRWQRSETELLVVVTPVVVDPMRPRARDTLRFVPDTTLPAREALEKRLPRPAGAPADNTPSPGPR